jgi:hypothetical protein
MGDQMQGTSATPKLRLRAEHNHPPGKYRKSKFPFHEFVKRPKSKKLLHYASEKPPRNLYAPPEAWLPRVGDACVHGALGQPKLRAPQPRFSPVLPNHLLYLEIQKMEIKAVINETFAGVVKGIAICTRHFLRQDIQ